MQWMEHQDAPPTKRGLFLGIKPLCHRGTVQVPCSADYDPNSMQAKK
jgi:hypothetical protein